jgi:2-polyprenyl-6-methoxyphenol hydroxylase-like FAD-dependent oxidoreductase
MFDQLAERGGGPQAGGAGGGTTYADLQRLDAAWLDLRTREVYGPRPEFVRRTEDPLPAPPALDVVVAGGTLGIFLAAALQAAGLKVAVVERGEVKGRAQEWNLSKKELVGMIELGVLSGEDAAAAISIEFNPVRAGFHGGQDVWTRDVLNIGVSPARLVAAARRRFEAAGGLVLERAALQGAWVHPDGVTLRLAGGGGAEGGVTAKLLVDAMGNASPIVRQVRHGAKPDGVCLVVGTCARGFDPAANATGDVIYTAGPSEPPAPAAGGGGGLSSLQQFWEAFPAGSGPGDRTTYMFTYLDAAPERPSLEAMLEHYWEAMPRYQGVALEALEVRRILFGVFSTYRDSPLPPAFDRVLAVGDASGIQSPLSFGGLGALARHLRRLTCAIGDAVEADALDRASLRFINGYNPGLSGAWMLQRVSGGDGGAARRSGCARAAAVRGARPRAPAAAAALDCL